MTPGATIAVVFAGFVLGTLVFVAVLRWVALGYSAYVQASATEPPKSALRTLVLVLCQSLFHAAPWTIIAVGYFAYHVQSEQWALWLFGGFCAALGYMVLVAATAAMRVRRRTLKNGTVNAA
jgi:uncharacterized membrane protein